MRILCAVGMVLAFGSANALAQTYAPVPSEGWLLTFREAAYGLPKGECGPYFDVKAKGQSPPRLSRFWLSTAILLTVNERSPILIALQANQLVS